MAQFTLTIPDAVVPRIRAAFGHFDIETATWINATLGEVQTRLLAFLKENVIAYETTEQAKIHRQTLTEETWQ
jgi:hypothetical protein